MRFPWENDYRASRWDTLARYNAERARGIMHTSEWQALMAGEQALFDAEAQAGHSILPSRTGQSVQGRGDDALIQVEEDRVDG